MLNAAFSPAICMSLLSFFIELAELFHRVCKAKCRILLGNERKIAFFLALKGGRWEAGVGAVCTEK